MHLRQAQDASVVCYVYRQMSENVVYAGILGAHAVLFATSMCIILVDIIEGNSVFTQWYTYLVGYVCQPCLRPADSMIAAALHCTTA